ncbi:hypothetical protein DQT32_03120 [Salmonella enterica subsp. enterica serovar Braenderup]|nr:hypothetical protein [Salmonella enterica subsp. enterica serovar Braenderup]
MITTIYNIVMIIISLTLIYTGNVQILYILYGIMCFGAIWITYSVGNIVKDYPNVTSKNKISIELVFYKEYGMRLSNYIGSYISHALILGYMLGNKSLLIAITATLIYRAILLNRGHKVVQKEIEK